jgi:hypothetical protein
MKKIILAVIILLSVSGCGNEVKRAWLRHIQPNIKHDLYLLTRDSLKVGNDPEYKEAFEWSKKIRLEILNYVNQKPDRCVIVGKESGSQSITYFVHGNKTIELYIDKKTNDTLSSRYYDNHENMCIVRELCPGISRNFEGLQVRHGYTAYGLAEFRFCDGTLKEQGFRYMSQNFGIWKEWNEKGELIKTTDYKHPEYFKKLIEMKFN